MSTIDNITDNCRNIFYSYFKQILQKCYKGKTIARGFFRLLEKNKAIRCRKSGTLDYEIFFYIMKRDYVLFLKGKIK
ncbi:hypothetical protein J19TS1_19250 [Heyndrickxia oleronia]|nr:hypothetical protein J19TS1_19250 [Heyndrickxia oleronia]